MTRRPPPLTRASVALGVALSVVFVLWPRTPAVAQGNAESGRDARFAGLEWQFTRIKYHYHTQGTRYSYADYGEPWYIDAPAAEQNLTRRIRSVTAIRAADPVILTLEDRELWRHPWIYFVEPGTLRLTDAEVPILREFLLRGGTATFDDFHGPFEFENLAQQLRKVFPDRPIVELAPPHPVYTCFYAINKYPQVAGLGSFLAGRTWEKGGIFPHLRTIFDDHGRPMVYINWNTDMGDGWEWSNAQDYPGYVKFTAEAYRMMINEIVYALTH
jgi:hypothetical protein